MKKFLRNDSGEMTDVFRGIIVVVITAIIVGALLPTALNVTSRSTSGASSYIGGVNVSTSGDGTSKAGNWSTSMLTTWDAIPILAALSVLVLFMFFAMRFLKG